MHDGPELSTVLEGEVTVRMNEDGGETVYTAEQTYSVPAETFFSVRNDGDTPARFIATLMIPEGKATTTPKQ